MRTPPRLRRPARSARHRPGLRRRRQTARSTICRCTQQRVAQHRLDIVGLIPPLRCLRCLRCLLRRYNKMKTIFLVPPTPQNKGSRMCQALSETPHIPQTPQLYTNPMEGPEYDLRYFAVFRSLRCFDRQTPQPKHRRKFQTQELRWHDNVEPKPGPAACAIDQQRLAAPGAGCTALKRRASC